MQTTLSRTSWLGAWTGTRDDLRLLVEHVKRALDDQRLAALNRVEARKAKLLAEGMPPDVADESVRREREREIDNFSVWVTAEDRRTDATRTGDMEEVLSAVSTDDLRKLGISYPRSVSQPRKVTLTFSESYGFGCTVVGDEAVWVEVMKNQTTTEARRGMPWWGVLFKPLGGAALSILVSLTLAVVVAAVASRLKQPLSLPGDLPLLVLTTGVISACLTHYKVLGRALPRFELLESGVTPTGTRRIAWLGTIIAGGLVGSFLSFLL